MAKKAFEGLTESMYYILLAFSKGEMCGTDVAQYIEIKTKSRVKIGPGTLYTILARFEEEKIIEETAVEGRKRIYRITERGIGMYQEELLRLKTCILDSEGDVL
ncbi:transcriptional regulator PadR-like family protein [Anaerotignum neopropionicum]|uniref:Transcriptional regulator PadR-like family protein n=1 Tax=Anaerotignum neopropionicum TaxID=36847 RepID=A0A136WFI5_9FIRM|nr:PadR family transcriptional regulator [Anaerotignum neopropionicum]KXL53217.1 transcriptional regulator PadR-like family protein [Anaerotignum neopropionicum]